MTTNRNSAAAALRANQKKIDLVLDALQTGNLTEAEADAQLATLYAKRAAISHSKTARQS